MLILLSGRSAVIFHFVVEVVVVTVVAIVTVLFTHFICAQSFLVSLLLSVTIQAIEFLSSSESIPVEQLVAQLCDIKQAYTQFGGKRPFGVSFLYMGYDQHYGFQVGGWGCIALLFYYLLPDRPTNRRNDYRLRCLEQSCFRFVSS